MLSRNGISSNFRITIVDAVTNAHTHLIFSFVHQALEEYTREKWLLHKFDDGTKEQKFLYLHTFFRIDWSELIQGPDADKLEIVRNAEFRGSRLLITPHTDVPGRFFEVITMKSDSGDSQDIYFNQTIDSKMSIGNKGTVMFLETKYPQQHWSIVDPEDQLTVVTGTFEEYY